MTCRRFLGLYILAGWLMGMWSVTALSGAELNESEFRKLQQQLQPSADALWRTIPWKITLLEAQRVAIQEKKPIFIWAMDGHPLGCT